ncbi:MAG TPA: Holliday junction resolvase RuvX [Candidatus Polarisedimenticolaceae bacterium]|nr:Holliday junction resolvase RuvX [Candidatus Polarisedimenticolaceae bacterium]
MSEPAARVLAVDLGDAHIGLALSDPLRITAQPLETLHVAGPRQALEQVAARARSAEAATVVVGLPLLMSGEAGERALGARRFAEALSERLGQAVRVELWDERLTSVQAERTMLAGNVRRKRRKLAVDAMAAVLILQSWLDAHP